MCIVVVPSRVKVNQIDGVNAAVVAASAVPPWSMLGRPMLMNAPAAVAAERTKNSRRVVVICSAMSPSIIRDLSRAPHGTYDAGICGAAAQVAGHSVHDLLVRRP